MAKPLYGGELLNEPELIGLHTAKWFQVLLFIVYTQLNAFKNGYVTMIVVFAYC